jgi:multiple sugar transport system substrate-binding protein
MRRRIAAALVLALSLLSVSVTACGGGSDESKAPAAKGKPVADPSKPVDLTLWTGFTERELGVIKHVVARFEKAHPNIHVKTVGGINDDKIVASIRGGNAPDVAHSFSSDNTGPFCSTGAWVDLASYMQRDGVEESIFPEAPRYYTEFEGKRCALPMLADVYGLYYNKALFAKAGLSGPPKTVSELTEYAKKLTQRNSDGSLKVVGFNPVMGFYENQPSHFAPAFDARWTDGDGKSSLAASPGWSDMLRWQ